jgi:ferrous iron transport protein B
VGAPVLPARAAGERSPTTPRWWRRTRRRGTGERGPGRAGVGPVGRAAAHSYGGRLGRAIEPAIEPLGFDWKIGIGLIGAFAAREVFVSTMGVVYAWGPTPTRRAPTLRQALRDERTPAGARAYTPLTGLSLMIFFALAASA